MTAQAPDIVRHQGIEYAVTAVDGTGLFEPSALGWQPLPTSTGCWRGFLCEYAIRDDMLVLDTLELGPDEAGTVPPPLHGVQPQPQDSTAWSYECRDLPVPFTGRLLLGDEFVPAGYLNMGFLPAWCYADVLEVVFDAGRLVASHDRSAELADVRSRLDGDGTRPAPDEDRRAWIKRTFSLSFDYSWPRQP